VYDYSTCTIIRLLLVALQTKRQIGGFLHVHGQKHQIFSLAITYCLLHMSAVKGVDLAANAIYGEAIMT